MGSSILRSIEEGRLALPERPPANWPRRIGTGALMVLLIAVVWWALSSSSAQRLPGQQLSGLDPRAAQDIVRLVRQIADRGRMVFLVSHDLSPLVLAQVDHLLVLVPGGRVAWFGPPTDACRYFGVETPDAIFDVIGGRPPEAWATGWRESRAFRRYVPR